MRCFCLSLFLGVFGLTCGSVFGQAANGCEAARRSLEAAVKDRPEKAREVLVSHIQADSGCAGPLMESVIIATEASDELVAELVRAAVDAAPDQAVVIAEHAIAAAPSASDAVAGVVQEVLGDCRSIAEDVAISIGRQKDRLLVIVEDALRAHGNCACEVVKAAIGAAGGSAEVISQIVEVAVVMRPAMAAEISECATAAAPQQVTAVQVGLDRALKDAARGQAVEAPPADPEAMLIEGGEALVPLAEEERAAEVAPEVTEVESETSEVRSEVETAAVERVEESRPEAATGPAYGKGETARASQGKGYGKGKQAEGGKQRGKGKAVVVEEEEEEEDLGWDWITWGVMSGHGGPVYFLAPAGGVVPPGLFEPVSPSDPKIPKKGFGKGVKAP